MMHQLSRDTDPAGRIVATLEDYAAVRSLVADLVAEAVGHAVPPTVRETVAVVDKLSRPEGVTVAAVAAELRIERSAATRRLHTARDRGYLVNIEDKPGKPARYLPGDPLPDEVCILPDPADVCRTPPCAHLADGETAGQGCDCTGVCRCASTAEGMEGASSSHDAGPLPGSDPS
jgi:hypothetical protein